MIVDPLTSRLLRQFVVNADVKVTFAKAIMYKIYKSGRDIKPNKLVNEALVPDFVEDLGDV